MLIHPFEITTWCIDVRAYITILGRSIWAVINALYAVLKQKAIKPDLIYIVTEDLFKDRLELAREGVDILAEEFGFKPKVEKVVVEEGNPTVAGREISTLIDGLKKAGFSIDIDITPGRKSLVAGIMIALEKANVENIYYLDIKTITDVNIPYTMIPMQLQSLKTFIEKKEGPVEHA
ncbi:MAG: hypothetical protein JW839_09360 [Candidatus Lokiarchaeota archaeon]|nr:hypothetical protein [Candidatus Lokiarchaeota archaeon]